MKLYHFTALEYLGKILEEGLTRGDVPLSETRRETAVWLTRNPEPDRQGWAGEPHVLTDEDREFHARIFKCPVPPPGARYPDKRALILEVEVPDGDSSLVTWLQFARLRGIKKRWLTMLAKAGGGRGSDAADWFIYRGTIPREWITRVAALNEEARAVLEEAQR